MARISFSPMPRERCMDERRELARVPVHLTRISSHDLHLPTTAELEDQHVKSDLKIAPLSETTGRRSVLKSSSYPYVPSGRLKFDIRTARITLPLNETSVHGR